MPSFHNLIKARAAVMSAVDAVPDQHMRDLLDDAESRLAVNTPVQARITFIADSIEILAEAKALAENKLDSAEARMVDAHNEASMADEALATVKAAISVVEVFTVAASIRVRGENSN